MKSIGCAVLVLIAGLARDAACATPGEARALAAGCASCHQPSERVLAPLAGQPRDVLIAKLRGFRDGTRAGTVMPQIARGYTESQLETIAAWFAAQKRERR